MVESSAFFLYGTSEANFPPNSNELYTIHFPIKKIHLMVCWMWLFLDSISWMLCLCKCISGAAT